MIIQQNDWFCHLIYYIEATILWVMSRLSGWLEEFEILELQPSGPYLSSLRSPYLLQKSDSDIRSHTHLPILI